VRCRADRGIQPIAARRRRPDAARAQCNIIKLIEKQKAAREEKLKDLLAHDKKDDGLVFDELGIDHVFVDEAHYFKNLDADQDGARRRYSDCRQ
jgi:N12 class adenine-specific DNA methylase